MKLSNAQFFISYQLRTWSTPKPISTILEKRRKAFTQELRSTPNLRGSDSSINSSISTVSAPANTDAASNVNHETLDFSEFFMSHEDVCGIALTESMIYIATKCQITVYSLIDQRILAKFGREGNDRDSFKHISYLYIPPNDKTKLYIVDRGQIVVHQYRINDSTPYFEPERRYFVIGRSNQNHNLQSCAIHGTNLYVSDSGNNCLHIFPLNGQRESWYLFEDSLEPFSPGPICAHKNYLYVANCSAEKPSILILNTECEPVDWFRNQSFRQILAIDIEPNINELFVLTTTEKKNQNNELEKRPLIVSMDLLRR